MKKRFTLLIAMVMLLTAMATNVFASSANNNSKVSPKEWQEWFNGLSKEEQLSVNYEPSQVLKALSANEVSKVNIDDKYETKTFLTELQNLYPTMEKKSINQYISSYIEIFNMYRGMYPNLSNKAIAEKTKANMLNKIEYMIDDSEYEAKDIIIRSDKEPDGYEAIVDYINKNLKPNYYATLDTTEENINILKRHINSLPNEVKESALLYIEDMESEDNYYAYALNVVSRTRGHKLQLGEISGRIFESLSCRDIINAAYRDMPKLDYKFRRSSYSEKPGYREYKVALVIGRYDYHWYRQDKDGGWSHKRGLTELSYRDASGKYIYDPDVCDRDYGNLSYPTFCGYYIIRY